MAGAPTKYKPEFCEQARKLCLLGAIDKDLAIFFEVHLHTILNWKKDYPEFLDTTKNAREECDNKVVRSLFERANGYTHPEEKVFCHEGMITTYETKKHYPPDTNAMRLWLMNRDRENWKERQEIAHTTPKVDGGLSKAQELLTDLFGEQSDDNPTGTSKK